MHTHGLQTLVTGFLLASAVAAGAQEASIPCNAGDGHNGEQSPPRVPDPRRFHAMAPVYRQRRSAPQTGASRQLCYNRRL